MYERQTDTWMESSKVGENRRRKEESGVDMDVNFRMQIPPGTAWSERRKPKIDK